MLASEMEWSWARALLLSYGVRIEPVLAEDAEWAARRWRRGEGLSLADRLCLALAERTDLDVLTADRAWGSSGRGEAGPLIDVFIENTSAPQRRRAGDDG